MNKKLILLIFITCIGPFAAMAFAKPGKLSEKLNCLMYRIRCPPSTTLAPSVNRINSQHYDHEENNNSIMKESNSNFDKNVYQIKAKEN